jgi:hypothetical protein
MLCLWDWLFEGKKASIQTAHKNLRAAKAALNVVADANEGYAGEGFPGAIPGVRPGSGRNTC